MAKTTDRGGAKPKFCFYVKKKRKQKIKNLSDTKIFNVHQEHPQKILRARGGVCARKSKKTDFGGNEKCPPFNFFLFWFFENSKVTNLWQITINWWEIFLFLFKTIRNTVFSVPKCARKPAQVFYPLSLINPLCVEDLRDKLKIMILKELFFIFSHQKAK